MTNWKEGPVPETLDEIAVVLNVTHLDPEVSVEDDYKIFNWFMEPGFIEIPDGFFEPLYTYVVGDFYKQILPELVWYNKRLKREKNRLEG